MQVFGYIKAQENIHFGSRTSDISKSCGKQGNLAKYPGISEIFNWFLSTLASGLFFIAPCRYK